MIELEINQELNEMHSVEGSSKGTIGERAVVKLCEELYQNRGGILYHSFEYKVDPNLPGNIKRVGGNAYLEALGNVTEIDVLYVSKYRVFPIEVKAYAAKDIYLLDNGISGAHQNEKSPVHQNEMHCRHLYANIFEGLPDGVEDYIVPIVCFVDEIRIHDQRSDWQKQYIHVTVLNNLLETLVNLDKPLNYRLNLTLMDRLLKNCCTHWEKYFPAKA